MHSAVIINWLLLYSYSTRKHGRKNNRTDIDIVVVVLRDSYLKADK